MSVEGILLAMTVVTGIVDAVSVLALGHVFTANMTGNVVFVGLALAGSPGFSITRSCTALGAFLTGALAGGKMASAQMGSWAARAFGIEAMLLLIAALVSAALDKAVALYPVIAITALAMGIRNAVVRKLAVPDLTTTVLTLTITGLAADSSHAGGTNPRWQRRFAAIMAMGGGAMAGALMLAYSVALPLCVCGLTVGVCALAMSRVESKGSQ
jgi:uncharacterized membrane protein YoaK (UPF0700 family)